MKPHGLLAYSEDSNENLINVFSENSQINEGRAPLNIYNQFFREEAPANKVYNKNDPFLINLNLRQKLNETNKMINVDNQNLLDKIQKMGKSIKPVNYGYPFIDLTKPDNEGEESGFYKQETMITSIKNNMQHLMQTKRKMSMINITDLPKTEM